MIMILTYVLCFTSGLLGLSSAYLHPKRLPQTPSVHTVASLAPGTLLESLVIRPNGDVLTTYSGEEIGLYTIKKPTSTKGVLELIAPLPGVETLWGVTEVSSLDDSETYVVVGGNLTSFTTFAGLPGSWKAWKITFSRSCDEVKTSLITDFLPDTKVLNGLTSIPKNPGIVLITQAQAGAIGRLDINTGHWDSSAFKYSEMTVPPSSTIDLGVSAVKIFGSHLYFSGAFGTLYRIAIDSAGHPLPNARVQYITDLGSLAGSFDDFIIDREGDIYVATNAPWNLIAHIDMSRSHPKVSKVVGGPKQLAVADCSSLAFGRGIHDRNVLYTSLIGNATIHTNARVVAINL